MPNELIRPQVIAGYEGWFRDFFELSTDRQIGMAVGPIPAASIERQGRCELFRRVIRAMDSVYLKHLSGDSDEPVSENTARDAFRSAMKGPSK